ncbi:MAG TPA: hypothetical protein VFS39_05505 [Nitrospira sp.]|nr:hypothetical protein [Nitrospira sp.]
MTYLAWVDSCNVMLGKLDHLVRYRLCRIANLGIREVQGKQTHEHFEQTPDNTGRILTAPKWGQRLGAD